MTMIRINLIAERKAGAPKAAKKPTGQTSEIQENLILIISVLLAFFVFMFMRHLVKSELAEKASQHAALEKEWEEVKVWKKKKEDFEIQKELLNEKIERISELKDKRQGPVKLMQDIANMLPESVWLESISQGYDKTLTDPTGKGRARHNMPAPIGKSSLVQLSGYASSQEAITNFANRILSLDKFYQRTDLNKIVRTGAGPQEYRFSIFFEVKSQAKSDDVDSAGE